MPAYWYTCVPVCLRTGSLRASDCTGPQTALDPLRHTGPSATTLDPLRLRPATTSTVHRPATTSSTTSDPNLRPPSTVHRPASTSTTSDHDLRPPTTSTTTDRDLRPRPQTFDHKPARPRPPTATCDYVHRPASTSTTSDHDHDYRPPTTSCPILGSATLLPACRPAPPRSRSSGKGH